MDSLNEFFRDAFYQHISDSLNENLVRLEALRVASDALEPYTKADKELLTRILNDIQTTNQNIHEDIADLVEYLKNENLCDLR